MSIRIVFMTICTATIAVGFVTGFLFALFSHSSKTWEIIYGIGLFGMLCILAAGVGFYYAQTIRRRLYHLEEAAFMIAGGRFHHRVKHFGERDEIDRLSSEFNEMSEKLEQQVGLLQRLADENQRLAEDAQKAATMEERQRLARDLHDSVSQQLFALSMLAQASVQLCKVNSPKLSTTIAQIADLATSAKREMRALLLHLRPVELAGRSFQEAAKSFLSAIEQRHGFTCSFTCLISDNLPISVEEQMFRILQEAMANVLKHAHASNARIRLEQNIHTYELTVADDGVGMAQTQNEASDNYGIHAMDERARRIGGRIELLTLNPGTAIRVVIPRTEVGEKTNDSSIGG